VYAIISDRNNQAKVSVGDVVACDLMDVTPGSEVIFDHVLLVSNEGDVKIGKPHVEGAIVKAEVIGEAKGKKLVIFRFKRRKGVRRKTGHRQHYTKVRITEING
jgi:large subunit ribosomal protein L21